jgi:Tol biopolymer transport system component
MFRRPVLLLVLGLSLLIAACGTPSDGGTTGGNPLSQRTPTATATTAPTLPTVQTDCPGGSNGRAAVMPALTVGHDSALIYTQRTSDAGDNTIYAFNLTTHNRAPILNISGSYVFDVQISKNGQWLFFSRTVSPGNRIAFQMVRVDGKLLQTLYCSPTDSGVLSYRWSPDMKYIAFSETTSTGLVKLLDLTNGQVRIVVKQAASLAGDPALWLDNTHLYLSGFVPNSDAPRSNIYLLDITRGDNQLLTSLTKLLTANGPTYDFDKSFDGSKLYIARNQGTWGMPATIVGPGTLVSQPAQSASGQQYVLNTAKALTQVRAITADTLLMTVNNTNDASENGIWKMGTNSTGLVRLWHGNATLNEYAQTVVNNNFYAFSALISNRVYLYYGPLAGGAVTLVANGSGLNDLSMVGWVTL